MKEKIYKRLKRQQDFFHKGESSLLIFADFTEGRRSAENIISTPPGGVLSEDFLQKNAYDLGVRYIRRAKADIADQLEVDSDMLRSGLGIDWGVGATAALFTGDDVIFKENTSYSPAPFIRDWNDLDKLELNLDNRWFEYELACWRGILSEYEEGLPIVTHMYRSPLDLAMDLRGNSLFLDFYDHPDLVHRLLQICTDAIISREKKFKEEISQLHDLPGGVWGVALPEPGMMFLNGDPVDLISPELGEKFNHPYIEKLADFAGNLYFHHHSIGVSRAEDIAHINGLTVQEIHQDPNGPRLIDSITDELIAASRYVPIDFKVDGLNQVHSEWLNLLSRLAEGRFIVRLRAETPSLASRAVEQARRYQNFNRGFPDRQQW